MYAILTALAAHIFFTMAGTHASPTLITGHIVMYDWDDRMGGYRDDFIVEIKGRTESFVRIHYEPAYGFDAPAASPEQHIDASAFIGRGLLWTFRIHLPEDAEERAACAPSRLAPIRYSDEKGSGVLPRHLPTPGGKQLSVARIKRLPCFILASPKITSSLPRS